MSNHTCINTATTVDGSVPPPCQACAADVAEPLEAPGVASVSARARLGRGMFTARVRGDRVDVWRDVEWLEQWEWFGGIGARVAGRKLLKHDERGELERALRAVRTAT